MPDAANILSTAKSLKRIWLMVRESFDISTIKNVIQRIFSKQTSLEQLRITVSSNHADSVLSCISKALHYYFISDSQRASFDIELRIVRNASTPVNVVDRLFNINSILNELHSSNFEDYALRVDKCRVSSEDSAAWRALERFVEINEKRFDVIAKHNNMWYTFCKKGGSNKKKVCHGAFRSLCEFQFRSMLCL